MLTYLRDDRGAAIVEFAIGASVLAMLVLLIAQGALMFHGWLAVTHAAREAARAGAPCYNRPIEACTLTQIRNWAQDAAVGVGLSDINPLLVSVGTTTLNGKNIKWLQVAITYQVPVIAPMVGAILPTGLTLSASSEMRLENQ